MKTGKLTDFGLCVKTNLLHRNMEQRDLIELVNADTGLFIDSGYLYKILTGKRNAPKIVESIKKILDIK